MRAKKIMSSCTISSDQGSTGAENRKNELQMRILLCFIWRSQDRKMLCYRLIFSTKVRIYLSQRLKPNILYLCCVIVKLYLFTKYIYIYISLNLGRLKSLQARQAYTVCTSNQELNDYLCTYREDRWSTVLLKSMWYIAYRANASASKNSPNNGVCNHETVSTKRSR